GAFAGADIARSNDASEASSVLIVTGTAALSGLAAGIIYDLFLEIAGIKEEPPADDDSFHEDDSVLMPGSGE
ncbi:MAG: hypothetical protein ACOC4H_02825, partial [bacterium]